MNFFAQNLKVLRSRTSFTQAEMAAQLGFPRTTWSTYENGGSEPSIDDILRIAQHFVLALDEIIGCDLSKGDLIVREKKGYVQPKSNLKGNRNVGGREI